MGYLGPHRGKRKAARQAKRLRERGVRYASPEQFQQFMAQYEPYIRRLMDPERVRMSDALAMGEQYGLQASDADAARYGLTGSGAHLAQRGAIRQGRQASKSEMDVELYLNALRQAMGLSERTQDRTLGALLGAPFVPMPSSSEPFLNFLGQYGGTALAGLGALSDSRLKYDIRPIHGYEWRWRADAAAFGKTPGQQASGLLAQDVAKVWPDAVNAVGGVLFIDYPLVAARLAEIVRQVTSEAKPS